MRSLRSRLIAGSSLVAVVPLAVAIYFLSHRIESMVRTQGAERLSAALGGLRSELRFDGERIAEKLRILARDPVLKRLYLLRPAGSRDLNEYLAERRLLLVLDFLEIADSSGTVVADGSQASGVGRGGPDLWHVSAVRPLRPGGLLLVNLEAASGLAMATSAPIRYESQTSGIVHGGLVLDVDFLERLKQRTGGVELLLRDGTGRTVATTLGDAGTSAIPLQTEVGRIKLADGSYLGRGLPIEIGAPPFASITGLVATASADRAIASLQTTSALLGLLGVGIAISLGSLWSSQISRPVERLAAFSRRVAQGNWDEPLTLHSVRELETLVQALDRMRGDLAAYRDKLIVSERQAAWSQMARKVAHEIKNPLTPIAISVADLKRSYEQQRADFPEVLNQAVRTIADEVETLKRLLQEFSDFARFPPPQFAPCRVSDILADLETLYGRDTSDGRLLLSLPDREATIRADAGQIRQALVNLIKNGLEAVEGKGRVSVSAGVEGAAFVITVSDTGPGLSAEQKANLFTPGFTTKPHGSGLGLTIVERIVSEHQGAITADTIAGGGTTFRIRLPLEERT